LPDISKINNVAVADISKLDSITFADGQKVNNQSVSLVTDAHVLIASDLASKGDGSHASLGFTSGIDDTYEVYEFHFVNIYPETNNVNFTFQVNNATDGAGYNDSNITSSFLTAYHKKDNDSAKAFLYEADSDIADAASYVPINLYVGDATSPSQSVSGILRLFSPSSPTFVKHFMFETNAYTNGVYSRQAFVSGYIDDTKAIDDITFKFSSGEIQGGEIYMYGMAKS
jgi:hypothetical protein